MTKYSETKTRTEIDSETTLGMQRQRQRDKCMQVWYAHTPINQELAVTSHHRSWIYSIYTMTICIVVSGFIYLYAFDGRAFSVLL